MLRKEVSQTDPGYEVATLSSADVSEPGSEDQVTNSLVINYKVSINTTNHSNYFLPSYLKITPSFTPEEVSD